MQDLKRSTKLTFWPSPQDYNEAIQNPHANMRDDELRASQVHTDKLGLPRPMTGAFASVYRMSAPKRDIAVRCFLRNISDVEQRYDMISDFVQHDELPYTVGFEFLREGIRVNSHWYPSLKMEYVEGLPLDAFVRENIKNQRLMGQLAGSFVKMVEDLARDGIAHGDLQHGNILVIPSNELRLVDYDGMFVPGMEGMQSNEVGHPNYQHPRRGANDFAPGLDNFSAWVIYASLKSLSIDPLLFHSLAVGDDCLLFRRDDFVQPDYSHAFALLEANPNEEIAQLARCVRWNLRQAPMAVAPLTMKMPEVGELPKVQPTRPGGVPDWMKEVTPEIRTNSRREKSSLRPSPQQLNPPPGVVPMPKPLLQFAPRKVQWKKSNAWVNPLTMQWLMLLNPLVWVLMSYMCYSIPLDECLITRGADTTGTVEYTQYVGGKGAHWTANYHYAAPDGTHYGSVSFANDGQLREGDTRPVRYDKKDFSHHVMDKDQIGTVNAARKQVNNDWWIVGLLVLANLAIEFYWWYRPLKHERIVKQGKAVRGKITRKYTKKGDKGQVYYYIEYSFTSSSGGVTKKENISKFKWDDFKEQQTVIVVYEEADPGSCVIYELGLYEAI